MLDDVGGVVDVGVCGLNDLNVVDVNVITLSFVPAYNHLLKFLAKIIFSFSLIHFFYFVDKIIENFLYL